MTEPNTAPRNPDEQPHDEPSHQKTKRRWPRVLGISVLAFVLFVATFGILFSRYSVRRAFPQVDGTVTVAGLSGEVEVIRDSLGIPHIYADTTEDLFMAQGYVHAQDRFFQMDFWRHIAAGELSEMFGDSQVETDAFLRTLGWGRLAQQQYEAESSEGKAVLDAYTTGVNRYVESQSPSDLSFEYSIIEPLNHGYDPGPWVPADSLGWGKAMAWDLGGNMGAEIDRARLLSVLPPERVAQLSPPFPYDRHPTITAVGGAGDESDGPAFTVPAAASYAIDSAAEGVAAINELLQTGLDSDIGSNSWVVSGEHSPTGSPLLANDPHLGSQMPSIWYQVGLHCRVVSPDCPYDVTGFSFAGVPGVIIGHNNDIGWGFTNTGPDVQDLFVEKVNPDNPNQYEVNGEWVDMEIRTETIDVAGGDDVTIEVRHTRHGPVISGVFEAVDELPSPGFNAPEPYVVTLRWTGLDETPSILTPILALNTASNWEEFQAAAETFAVPAQNLLYADRAGNIGYQMPGRVPIRATGDGTLPVPGWTDDHEWIDYIDFDELPNVLNPDSGWIVTANNAVVDESFPYDITYDYAMGYRAQRIVDLLTSNLGIGIEGFATLQFDSYDLNAAYILPYLENALVVEGFDANDQQQDAINHLFRWDLQNFAGSTGAAVWNAFWSNLLLHTFEGDIPEDSLPAGNGRWFEVMRGLLDIPDDPFWDDPTTGEIETRDVILVESFVLAVEELDAELGSTVSDWRWGDLHTITFQNQTLGDSGIGLIEDRFNRGPYPASGSKAMVNAVGWTVTEGYEVDWLPSMRMVLDLSDWSNSTAVHTTGQSGHVDHPHYDDMIQPWLAGETYPMLWTRDEIDDDAEAVLILQP